MLAFANNNDNANRYHLLSNKVNSMKNTDKLLIAAITGSSFCSFYTHAAQYNPDNHIKVAVKSDAHAETDDPLSSQTITEQEIKDSPSSNSNLSDYLKAVPGARVESKSETGFTNGEIKPLSVSINGAPSEQTAYMIDGVNINNDIDPASSLFDGTMGVNPNKSSEQAYFFDAKLLSGITVYSNNVPANLGGFTGGAVVAETRQYSGENHASVSYRTTRSSWASLKADEAVKDALDKKVPNGMNAEFQPVYKKEFFNLTAEYGLTDNTGMVFGFSRRDSDIRQTRMLNSKGETDNRNHTRRSDNMLVNFNWTPDTGRTLEAGFRMSDYKEGKFYANNIDNNVNDTHQAYGTTIRYIQSVPGGKLTSTAAYDKFSDKRRSNSTEASVVTDLDTGLDFEEGGYGNSQLTQENINLILDYNADPVFFGNTEHVFNTGADYRHTAYAFKRDEDVHSTVSFIDSTGRDVLLSELTASKGTVNTSHQNYALYAQDTIKTGDFTFRPGLRLERDNYLSNTNIAPRFTAYWQALPDTRFKFGLNRYYGRSFATMKLSGKILELNQDRTRDYRSLTHLSTPHSDELNFGVNQDWNNWRISADYTYRKYKQRIVVKRSTQDDKKVDSFTNGDDFNAQIYTLQITNKTPWTLGATEWNTTLGADWLNTGRADLEKTLDPDEAVILDGRLMSRAQMEKEVNNNEEEWMVRLGVDMKIPDNNITWSNKFYIKAPVHSYAETNSTDDITVYKTQNFGTHTQWDTSLSWQPAIYGSHQLYFRAEVLNVLNQVRKMENKGYSSNEYGIYTPGREFWLEVGYEF